MTSCAPQREPLPRRVETESGRLWLIKLASLKMEADTPPSHGLQFSVLASPDLTPRSKRKTCNCVPRTIACAISCFRTDLFETKFALQTFKRQRLQGHKTQIACCCPLLHLHQSLLSRLECLMFLSNANLRVFPPDSDI